MATTTAAPIIEVNEALLDQYIEDKVNSMFADEPGIFKSACLSILATLLISDVFTSKQL